MAESTTDLESTRPDRRLQLVMAGIVLVAVVLRVAVALAVHGAHPERAAFNDSPSYLEPALALVHDGHFDRAPGSSTPEFVRSPGYPAFIATVFFLAGESETALVGVQAALSGLSVLLGMLLSLRLTDSLKAALAVGMMLALDPFQTAIAGWLLTESLATTLITLTAYCLVRLVQADFAPRWGVAAGLALAAATFVRPTTLYFPLVLAALFGVALLRDRERRTVLLRAAGAVLLPCLVLFGAWSVRNQSAVGSSRFSGIEGLNMYWYRAADVVSRRDGVSLEDAQRQLTEELNPGDTSTEDLPAGQLPSAWKDRQGEYYDRAQSEGLDIVLSEPVLAARSVAKGVYQQFVQSGWGDVTEHVAGRSAPAPVAATGLLVVWGIEALALVGMVLSLRRSDTNRWTFVLPIVLLAYTVLVSAGPEAAAGYRFRAPLWPIWCTFAVIGARALAGEVVRRRAAPAAGAP
jgi:4-amino-4-deoxy-L-arabinose transferase-like glycosyltransferase